jgi:hypothetical protein
VCVGQSDILRSCGERIALHPSGVLQTDNADLQARFSSKPGDHPAISTVVPTTAKHNDVVPVRPSIPEALESGATRLEHQPQSRNSMLVDQPLFDIANDIHGINRLALERFEWTVDH